MKVKMFILGLLMSSSLIASTAWGADQDVAIMLGGEGCESHPDQITKALMAQKGVKSVDLKKIEGHAVVTFDGSTKPETLVKVIQDLKGTKDGVQWHCEAMIMN